MDDENLEVLEIFLVESREGLAEVEAILIEIESTLIDSGELDLDSLNKTFRVFHSIKGTAGFLGLDRLVSVTHHAESLLDRIRAGELPMRKDHVTVLCRALDFANEALSVVESEHSDLALEDKVPSLVEALELAAKDDEQSLLAQLCAPVPPETPVEAMATAIWQLTQIPDDPDFLAEAVSAVELFGVDAPPAVRPIVDQLLGVLRSPQFSASDMPAVEAASGLLRGLPVRQSAAPVEAAPVAPVAPAPVAAPKPAAVVVDDDDDDDDEPRRSSGASGARNAPSASSGGSSAAQGSQMSIRVNLEKLDTLMDLVGELIIAENMVTHHEIFQAQEIGDFHKAVMQLNRITRSLQDMVMSVRMMPVGPTFRRMMRLVRDLSQKLGKPVELTLEGQDTEVDKTVLEGIADPLVHVIRNALDHGLEDPEERAAAGKPARGEVRLEARHEGGEVWIIITDDGRGLDRRRILAKASENGLIDGDGSDLRDDQVFGLIFEPGFSTAANVTDVSGRGVGMDVVRRNIQSLKGRIDIHSTLGKGTTITLRIPLTLAIIEGMLVRLGDAVYIIPLLGIRESVRLTLSDLTRLPTGEEFVQVRGQFFPLARLGRHYGTPNPHDIDEGIVIVVDYGAATAALLVDEIIGQRQTVIKALPSYLGRIEGLSGCSILSNGDISLILDVGGLVGLVAA